MPRSNYWDAVSQRSALGQRWTPRQRMTSLGEEQDIRRDQLGTQAVYTRPQQEQATYPMVEGGYQGAVQSRPTGPVWGRASIPEGGINYENWGMTLGRPALRYALESATQPAAEAATSAVAPAAIEATGEGLSTAGLESGASAYMAGTAGEAAGEAAASGAGAEAAGVGAGGWLALAYIIYKAWKGATQGSGQNEPMIATRDIALGGRDLSNLLQGIPSSQEDELRLPRYYPEYTGEYGTGVSVGNYGPENINELYERLHQTSRGGYSIGDPARFHFGFGEGADRTHITDQDVDNYLYAQGVTREQLSQAIGYEPPDWETTTWREFYPERLRQLNMEREQRIRENRATDEDIASFNPYTYIGEGAFERNQNYWTALQARDPNLPEQQAVSLGEE